MYMVDKGDPAPTGRRHYGCPVHPNGYWGETVYATYIRQGTPPKWIRIGSYCGSCHTFWAK